MDSCIFFLYGLYFGFFLNRGKTVKYFPTKYPSVISRAVHTIELSFPLINLHLTSLPEAVSDPFVPPLKYCTLSGEHICHSGAAMRLENLGEMLQCRTVQNQPQVGQPNLSWGANITCWRYLEVKRIQSLH